MYINEMKSFKDYKNNDGSIDFGEFLVDYMVSNNFEITNDLSDVLKFKAECPDCVVKVTLLKCPIIIKSLEGHNGYVEVDDGSLILFEMTEQLLNKTMVNVRARSARAQELIEKEEEYRLYMTKEERDEERRLYHLLCSKI